VRCCRRCGAAGSARGVRLAVRARLEQLAEAARARPDAPGEDWTAQLRVYAEESNLGNQRLAESAGLAAERWFATMLRDLTDGAPEVALPAAARESGLRIVAYTHDRDDDARLARNDAFRDHWGSLPSQRPWAKFVGGEFFRPDLSRLVVGPTAPSPFCLASVNEDDWASLGASNSYIDLIGVVRARRRQGWLPPSSRRRCARSPTPGWRRRCSTSTRPARRAPTPSTRASSWRTNGPSPWSRTSDTGAARAGGMGCGSGRGRGGERPLVAQRISCTW
jgi:hypothetical protein